MAWFYLLGAGLLEILWAYSMKKSQGFTQLTPTIITLVAMIASFGLRSLAGKTLPLGTAYPRWPGIGAVGAFILGIALLGGAITPIRVIAAILIVSGIIAMKLGSSH